MYFKYINIINRTSNVQYKMKEFVLISNRHKEEYNWISLTNKIKSSF